MALLTIGTNATTSLQALIWQPSGMSATDLATLMALIRDPQSAQSYNASAKNIKSILQDGILYVPGGRTYQGFILKPGDYIAVDSLGWPIVIPGYDVASVSPASSWS